MTQPRPRAKLSGTMLAVMGVGLWIFAIIVGVSLWLAGRGPVVAEHVHLADPLVATRSFLDCLSHGHSVDVLACVVDRPEQQRTAQGLIDGIDAGLEVGHYAFLPTTDATALSAENVVIDGDVATISVSNGGRFVLRRDAGRWRVDLFESAGWTSEQAAEYLWRLENALRPADAP